MNDSVRPVKASVSSVRLVKARPMLIEKTLTAGIGKQKHVVGVEMAFKTSLDRTLVKELATRPTDQPVDVQLGSSSSGGENLAGTAKITPGGLIVVVAKS